MNIKSLKTLDELNVRIFKFITKEQLTQLSKDYVCPHYRLQNPVSKEEVFLYDNQEVFNWIESDLLKYNPSTFKPVINLYKYTLDKREGYTVPNELAGIQNLFHLPLQEIMTPPGIYFLVKDNQLVYIGQAVNILSRVLQHVNEGTKSFDCAFFMPLPIDMLDSVERSFINVYRPVYNLSVGPVKPEHKEVVSRYNTPEVFMKKAN